MTLDGKKIILLRLVADDIINGPHPRNKIPPLELKYIEALLKETEDINVELFGQLIYKYKDSELSESYCKGYLLSGESHTKVLWQQVVEISFSNMF